MSSLDFEEHVEKNAADKPAATLENLKTLVEEADLLDKQIDELDAMRNSMASRYNHIKTHLIPGIMSELQSTKWQNENGTKVEIADYVTGSLPKDEPKRGEAIKLLKDNDAGSLIRTEVTVQYGVNQHNEALAFVDDLRKKGLEPVVEHGVNAAQLQAFGREAMKNGLAIDLDKLGLFAARVAKITHGKKKEPRKVSATKKKPKLGKDQT